MRAALKLFKDIGIRSISVSKRHPSGTPMATCAGNVVERLIRRNGMPHATLTLRTIVESSGNERALIADIIEAVSDVIQSQPRWANLGLEWLAAFDQICLLKIRRRAKEANARPLRVGISTLICVELEKILGPNKVVELKPAKVKPQPKPPRSVSRIPEVRAKVHLGVELLALRAATESNRRYGQIARLKGKELGFRNLDGTDLSQAVSVARRYAGRPEIIDRVSWVTLVALASRSVPENVRTQLEASVIAGKTVTAPDVVRARGPLNPGRPKQADRPAQRVAA